MVTFIGRQIEANRISAKRVVGLKAVVDRLDKHVRSGTEAAGQEQDAAARTAKERQLAELKARLERTITRQLEPIQRSAAQGSGGSEGGPGAGP